MGMTLEQFAAECRRILESTPGPAGRKKVGAVVQEMLKDEAFITRHVGDDVPERKILYEDPALGFCILAHNYTGVKESAPHDHGPSWAIYGQARGETVMTDWTAGAGHRGQGRQGQARAQLSAEAWRCPRLQRG
jgi:hypothetical protein